MTPPHAASPPDHGLSHGLPNAHYTDPGVIALENTAVLAGGWASVGFAKDVPNKGDVAPVTFLKQPLMLVRGGDGNVRVFENVCRHRGMILVDQPTNFKGTIRCPYHSWCYGFDGKLRTTPHVGGPGVHTHADVDPSKLGLFEVRSAVWMDVVFVNLDRQAPSFEDFIRPVAERWHDFAGRTLYHGGEESTFELEVNCNWKLAVENYCESYHLPWVHPALNEYSKLEDHYEIIDPNGNFSGQGTRVYAPNLGEPGRQFTTFDALPAAWDTAAEYISLFPNTLLGVHKDHTFATASGAVCAKPMRRCGEPCSAKTFSPSKACSGAETPPVSTAARCRRSWIRRLGHFMSGSQRSSYLRGDNGAYSGLPPPLRHSREGGNPSSPWTPAFAGVTRGIGITPSKSYPMLFLQSSLQARWCCR